MGTRPLITWGKQPYYRAWKSIEGTKYEPIFELDFKGRIAWDIGANHGDISRWLCKRFLKVYSFEPFREAFQQMVWRMEPNQSCYEYAIGNVDGVTSLKLTKDSRRWGMLTSMDQSKAIEQRSVVMRSMDSLRNDILSPDFIKIDTEGMESEVIFGGWGLIRDERPTLYVEFHRQSDRTNLTKALSGLYSVTDLGARDSRSWSMFYSS